MGTAPSGLGQNFEGLSSPGNRFICHTFQPQTPFVHVSVPSPQSRCGGQPLSGLESMAVDLSVSSNHLAAKSPGKAARVQGPSSSGLQTSFFRPDLSGALPEGIPLMESGSSSHSDGQRGTEGGLRDKILAMDRLHIVKEALAAEVGEASAARIVKGKRESTSSQQQVAWTALQAWLRSNPAEDISVSSMLKFFIFLKDAKKLAPVTIKNYRVYLALPLRLVANLDLNDWRFKELDNSFFIESPRTRPSLPSWSVQEVLTLLGSPSYLLDSCSAYNLLKKTVFLVALATGNRVSEVAAMHLPLFFNDNENTVQIPVKPGFLYKNQRAGRSPPNIIVKGLSGGPREWCPLLALKMYIHKCGVYSGPLFRNSRSMCPLRPQTISRLLCGVIEEAVPDCIPKAHDVRKAAASLAWTRGLKMEEITQRAFWSSSNTFIDHYLRPCVSGGVALNTEP